jgi:hypothetical protein
MPSLASPTGAEARRTRSTQTGSDQRGRNFPATAGWEGATPPAAALLPFIPALLALAVFLDTERLARAMGHGLAADLRDNPAQMASVTVVTSRLLDLGPGGDIPQAIRQPDGSTIYRYGGLRLLQRSGDRYFLVPEHDPGRRPRVILLRDADPSACTQKAASRCGSAAS